MDYSDILRDIEALRFKPIYLFDGEESFFMDALTERIEALALAEHERDFNQSIIYAPDIKPEELLPLVKRYPMMAERQLVIVREAQQWRSIEALASIFTQIVPTTVLVFQFRGKKIDGRSTVAKLAKKVAVCHTGNKLRDWEVQKWITAYAQKQGYAIDEAAVSLLAEHVGTDMLQLTKAFQKCELFVPKGKGITIELVSNLIGVSKDYNVFEYQKALGFGQNAKAMKIANYFALHSKDNHVVMVVSAMFRYFARMLSLHSFPPGTSNQAMQSKLGLFPQALDELRQAARLFPQERVWRVMDILYDIELKSKGVTATNADPGDLVKELTARIIYG